MASVHIGKNRLILPPDKCIRLCRPLPRLSVNPYIYASREGILSDPSDDEPEPPPEAAAPAGDSSEGEAADTRFAVPVSSTEARQRAANAALARLTASQNRPRLDAAADPANGRAGSSGGVATSAVEAGAGAGGEATIAAAACSDDGSREEAQGGATDELDMEGLTEVAGEAGARLLVAAGVRTLGELADRDEENLTRQLGVLQEAEKVHASAASAGGGDAGGEGDIIGAEQVSEWVQGARGEELDEIMADIVGGDEDVVEVRLPRCGIVLWNHGSVTFFTFSFVWCIGGRRKRNIHVH